jgi:excinuclease ABC subunit B
MAGRPEEYGRVAISLQQGEIHGRDRILKQLVAGFYERNDAVLEAGRFRVRGDTLEVMPAYGQTAYRIEFWGDEIERIVEVDALTGEVLAQHRHVEIYPAKLFITPQEKLSVALESIEAELEAQLTLLRSEEKLLEAQRLEQRTRYDMEMLREVGYCSGIENYSRHLSQRQAGEPPWTLLDYFPEDAMMFIDESHMTVPQVRGMYNGDRARKDVLVGFGFRLPSALDNRPLTFEEFEDHVNQCVFVSATPGPYEQEQSSQVVEQVIRPTGLVDPEVVVRPIEGQIDDLMGEIRRRVQRGERTQLIPPSPRRMARTLGQYARTGYQRTYLHSEITPRSGGHPARLGRRLRRGGGCGTCSRGFGPS